MKYFEAPSYEYFNKIKNKESPYCLFLAGSITGAWNWQKEITSKLIDHYHIFNPRREDFDVTNPMVEREQITWEYNALNFCDNILFYFSDETLAPITLLELGTVLHKARYDDKSVFICIHPEYKRKNDVIIQTELRAPYVAHNICFDLDELVDKLIHFVS